VRRALEAMMVRKIQRGKMRGHRQSPGVHTFRISDQGLEIFPRAVCVPGMEQEHRITGKQRLSMGVDGLDAMMGGGLPAGYSLLVVGPSGSGKSVLATQFLAEGARVDEKSVIAAFEKSPNQLLSRQLNAMVESGAVGVVDTRTLDLSIDELLHDLMRMIRQMDARRVVIDSLSGFELALAPIFREDFHESLYRMVAVLTSMGVTVLMTADVEDQYGALRFSSYGTAFLSDAILMQRYAEIDGKLRRVMSVVKVPGSEHSKDIRFFDIVGDAFVLGDSVSGYSGILSGQPSIK
jgi:circadian clock protein KaiC